MHGVMGKPPDAATDNGGIATSKIDAADARRDDGRSTDLALHAGAGTADARDHVRARYLRRADDGVALHGRHRLLADHHGAAVGPVRAPASAARRPRPDGGGERRLHFRGEPAATDRRAFPAGARRRHRHGGEPRHHPRSLQSRAHRLHDQPRHRRHDDRADAVAADRRSIGDRVRLARDLLSDHRRVADDRGHASPSRCPRPAATARKPADFAATSAA